MRGMINFIIVLIAFIYIIIPFILFLFLMLRYIKESNKFVFITGYSPERILERMNAHNVKDIFLFEFYPDNKMQNYIFITKEINKDWYYKEGSVKYEFIMKTDTEGTEISLSVIERSSLRAQNRYGRTMKEFMLKKLAAIPRGPDYTYKIIKVSVKTEDPAGRESGCGNDAGGSYNESGN